MPHKQSTLPHWPCAISPRSLYQPDPFTPPPSTLTTPANSPSDHFTSFPNFPLLAHHLSDSVQHTHPTMTTTHKTSTQKALGPKPRPSSRRVEFPPHVAPARDAALTSHQSLFVQRELSRFQVRQYTDPTKAIGDLTYSVPYGGDKNKPTLLDVSGKKQFDCECILSRLTRRMLIRRQSLPIPMSCPTTRIRRVGTSCGTMRLASSAPSRCSSRSALTR